MTPHVRKVALFAASLGLLLSLFLALRPEDDETATTTTSTSTATAATTTAATTAVATAPPMATGSQGPGTIHIDYTISGGRPVGGIGRDSVSRGRIVVIRATSDVADHVHLHGYNLKTDVAPGAPETIVFTATVPGSFEVELEESGVQLAELEVRP